MRTIDWAVLFSWLFFLTAFGLYRGRGSRNVNQFLLAGKTMPWYAMGLSILATQASAVTFISTTGQGYVDGLRFVQFYFGLPLAMIVISMIAVPVFHRAKVYTAYEFLEVRFDSKTRALVSGIFVIQRGLSAGIGLYAPAVALSAVLGWSDRWTTVLIGALVVTYTVSGGIKALTWADVLQMSMIFFALLASLFIAVHSLPDSISFRDALHLAGAAGRLKIVDPSFNWSDRYNLWSGLIGGGFLALAYFGCDQSQVQRYLTGRSISESRLSLMFNAVVKIPMQSLILFIGAMVFVLSLFAPSPAIFQPEQAALRARSSGWRAIENRYTQTFEHRRETAYALAAAARDPHTNVSESVTDFRQADKQLTESRKAALGKFDDTNYIFLSFVLRYLPAGLVGLTIGVIFSASMGSTSGEINSLATVSVIDLYKRYVAKDRSDGHYLLASRVLTVFWGAFAVGFACFGSRGFGALIERVNIVGSLFYGGLLGVFVLAFGFRHVRGTAAFVGVLAGEAAIFIVAAATSMSFLWYNVVGCVGVVLVGLLIERVPAGRKEAPALRK